MVMAMPVTLHVDRIPSAGDVRRPRATRLTKKEIAMQWITPAYCDIRLGFEVTAYVYVR